jgi:hypothetical protein
MPPVGEMAPKRRSRRQSATRGLDRAFDGSEYEKTNHVIRDPPRL